MSNDNFEVLHKIIHHIEQSLCKTRELPEEDEPEWWLDHLAGRIAAYELLLEYLKEMEEVNEPGRV